MPSNIVTPGKLKPGTAYFWRVDTVAAADSEDVHINWRILVVQV